MEQYWREKPRINQECIYGDLESDIKWPFKTPVPLLTLPTKEWCYGYVVNSIMMTGSYAFSAVVPPKEPKLLENVSDELLSKLENVDGDDIITYLYAMREITTNFPGFRDSSTCDLRFPPRHKLFDVKIAEVQPSNPMSVMSAESMQCLVNAAVNCFAGALPKVFQIGLHPHNFNVMRFIGLEILSNAMVLVEELQYISLYGDNFGDEFYFLEAVVSLADNLKVIIVQEHPESESEPNLHLDILFTKLSTTSFLSKFHSLVLISHRFVVSQSVLDDFLRKFLSTPCDHPQAIKLAYITIEDFMLSYVAIGARPPSSPFWFNLKLEESSYLHLKSIEFCLPRFKVRVPLANLVADWCGQNVSLVTAAPTVDVMNSFTIDFPRPRNPRKRPHTEVDE